MATAAFGEIVALLRFSPVFKHLSLGDLEWLVIPWLATNQVTVVWGKRKNQQGCTIPLGLALWARVSEDVDKTLEAQQNAHMPFRPAPLAPNEVAQALVKKLEDTVCNDTPYKRFVLGKVEAQPISQAKGSEGEHGLAKTLGAP